MKKISIYAILGLGVLTFQGCGIPFQADVLKPADAQQFEYFMQANQTFECQNDLVGAAYEYNVKNGTIFGVSKIGDTNVKVSQRHGSIADIDLPKEALFLEYGSIMDTSFVGFIKNSILPVPSVTAGFLVYPSGEFVFETEEQMGAFSTEKDFFLQVECKWTGKTPFTPMTKEEYLKTVKQ